MAPSATEPASEQTLNGELNQLPKGYGRADSAMKDFKFEGAELNDHVLKSFRCLIADLCEQFKGGHPGSAMGMAAIGVALWKYMMRYSPENPDFFNRDRFVLSNGKIPALTSSPEPY